MIADTEYKCNLYDQSILVSIIVSLCDCMDVYYEEVEHESFDDASAVDSVRALHLRSIYGGMKGDMAMLSRACQYYAKFPEKIVHTNYDAAWPRIESDVGILEEAIDFHPFPAMLTMLAKKTGIDPAKIKQAIWLNDSCINVRKKTEPADMRIWQKIEPHIRAIRYKLIS